MYISQRLLTYFFGLHVDFLMRSRGHAYKTSSPKRVKDVHGLADPKRLDEK